jgi:hypothetical protein
MQITSNMRGFQPWRCGQVRHALAAYVLCINLSRHNSVAMRQATEIFAMEAGDCTALRIFPLALKTPH